LKPVLKSIRKRRNEWFAHLAESTVRDPAALNAAANLTMKDLDQAFADTENILSSLTGLYDGTVGPIRFSGGDDYLTLLRYVHDHQIDLMNKFRSSVEQQFGHPLRP
jgi:AbiU2